MTAAGARIVLRLAAAAVALCALASPGHGQGDQVLGRYQSWIAVAFIEDGKRICYIVSEPKKSEGAYSRRGPVYVQVTRRGKGAGDVVSFEAGYRYKDGVEVELAIDDKTFKLFTQDETAWARDAKADRQLVEAMRQGKRMVVVGYSWRGTKTTDTYSLFGFTKAHRKMVEECG